MAEFRDGRIVGECSVPVDVDAAFSAVATGGGLKNWFPLHAEVEPRLGGRCFLSWGENCEGEAPVHVYDPPSSASGSGRFGWTESYPAPQEGEEPVVRLVDFHVKPGGDGTGSKISLIHSGFSPDADPAADELSAYLQGWSYFLYGLEFYLTRHAGTSRRLVWHYGETGMDRAEAWDALIGGQRCAGGLVSVATDLEPGAPITFTPVVASANQPGGPKLSAAVGRVISSEPLGHLSAHLPSLGHSLLFIEFESTRVGIWLSTYGLPEGTVSALQESLNRTLSDALPNGTGPAADHGRRTDSPTTDQ